LVILAGVTALATATGCGSGIIADAKPTSAAATGATPTSPRVSSASVSSGTTGPGAQSSSGSVNAQAVKELCGASVGEGLHGDAHVFQRQSAAQAIVASFTAESLAKLDPGVTVAQLQQALQAGDANIYLENPNGQLAYIDGSPVPGPTRIAANTVLPGNSEVAFFFTCGAPNVITH